MNHPKFTVFIVHTGRRLRYFTSYHAEQMHRALRLNGVECRIEVLP